MVSSLMLSVSDILTSACAFTVASMVTLQGTVPCPLVLSPMPPGLRALRTIMYILIVRVHPPTSNVSTPFPYAILLRLPLLYAPLLQKPVITSIDNSVKLHWKPLFVCFRIPLSPPTLCSVEQLGYKR